MRVSAPVDLVLMTALLSLSVSAILIRLTLLRTFNVLRIDICCVSEPVKVQKRSPSLLAGSIESAIHRQVNLTGVRKLIDIESKSIPARHSKIRFQIREISDGLMLMQGYLVIGHSYRLIGFNHSNQFTRCLHIHQTPLTRVK
jgi:hypothetical protein